jgi:ATP-binding cassette subfamily F protein 3
MLALTADRLVLVDGGTATEYAGSLEDYTDLILKGDGSSSGGGSKDAPRGNRKDERRAAAEAREKGQKLRKAAHEAEKEVGKLEARKKALERAMFDPSTAAPADAALAMSQLMKLHAEAVAGLAKAEARWLEASEAIEQAEAA